MTILAFDTCFDACSVAVARVRADGSVDVVGQQALMATGQAEALMPMIARVMAEAGTAFADISRIAATHGPGTFTGTRITVAAARAFQLALGVPVVPVSSLSAIGRGALSRLGPAIGEGDALLVVRDARRGEVYAEAIAPDGCSLTGPRLLAVADAAALAESSRLLAVGSGATLVAEAARARRRASEIVVIGADVLPAATLEPDARQFAAWAMTARAEAAPLAAVYVRPPDAKPPSNPSVPRLPVKAARDG